MHELYGINKTATPEGGVILLLMPYNVRGGGL